MAAVLSVLPDPAFCGCDPSPVAGHPAGLVPVDEAIRRGLALVRPIRETEVLPLSAAHGRVLAAAPCDPRPLPPVDRSVVDGYALRLSDLRGAGPWRLPVAGGIAAGDGGGIAWPPATALRIPAGAPVPAGCDAVAMQEAVRGEVGAVLLDRRPAPGENIRRSGKDAAAGAPLLAAGRRIDPRAAALLAAARLAEAEVRRRLRVALLAIGPDLRSPGARPAGPSPEANLLHLAGALALPWIELADHGILPDRPEALRAGLERAAQAADLVVTTGGTSMGEAGLLPQALRALGAGVQELNLAMEPGGPLLLGRIGGALHLGLPGDPVAAFVAWLVIGARLAEALAGVGEGGLRKRIARAGFDRSRGPGCCAFLPARLTGYGVSGAEEAVPLEDAGAHRLALLAAADGLLLLPAEADRVTRGDLLDFIPF